MQVQRAFYVSAEAFISTHFSKCYIKITPPTTEIQSSLDCRAAAV